MLTEIARPLRLLEAGDEKESAYWGLITVLEQNLSVVGEDTSLLFLSELVCSLSKPSNELREKLKNFLTRFCVLLKKEERRGFEWESIPSNLAVKLKQEYNISK